MAHESYVRHSFDLLPFNNIESIYMDIKVKEIDSPKYYIAIVLFAWQNLHI